LSPAAANKVAPESIAWLRAHWIEPSRPQPVDVTALIRQMRDGD
jgi:hypothetical protein